MLATLLLTLLLVLLSCVIGQGLLVVCGCDRWRWWAPALGFAVLLVVGGQVIRIPHHATTGAIAIVVLFVGALLLPGTWRGLRQAGPGALILGVVVLLLSAIPLFAAGHVGTLGESVSNDMSSHLTGAWWIRTHIGLRPAAAIGGTLIETGYPMGGHGVVAALVALTGQKEVPSFDALQMCVPVLTAFTAYAALPRSLPGGRWVVAGVIGLAYLPIAFLAQGLFKETIQSMLVLAAAVAIGDLMAVEPRGWWERVRLGIPFGVIAAAGIYNYSYAGAFWMIGTGGLVLFIAFLRARGRRVAGIKAGWIPVLVAVLVGAILIIPEINRMTAFANSLFGVEPKRNHGNLPHAVNPFETLGVWLSGDFRRSSDPIWPSIVLQVIAGLALFAGLPWWWKRRRLGPPAATFVAVVIWIDLAVTRNIYNAAKGLVVVGPVALLCLAAPLLAAWSPRAREALWRPLVVVARGAAVIVLVGAVVSSFLVLRSTVVGNPQEHELSSFRPIIGKDSVLFLGSDQFGQWELRGTTLFTTSGIYVQIPLGKRNEKFHGNTVDVDNYFDKELNMMRWIITTNAPFQSSVPANFHVVKRTRDFVLYKRNGPTPDHVPVEPEDHPYGILDCSSPSVQALLPRYPRARVVPAPVQDIEWHGSISKPGHTATTHVALPKGRWDVSLQYLSQTGAVITGPGLRYHLPAYLGRIGAYFYGGTLTSPGGDVTLHIRSNPRNWFGRLLGPTRGIHAATAPGNEPLWHVAFTRHGARGKVVPSRAACGNWVDWLTASD